MGVIKGADDGFRQVRRAGSYAIVLGVLKLLIGIGSGMILSSGASEIVAIDRLVTIVAGIALLVLGVRVRWKPERSDLPLLGLIAIVGLTLILALAAGRPIKVGIDFLLLGVFVVAQKSLSSNPVEPSPSDPPPQSDSPSDAQEDPGDKMSIRSEAQPDGEDLRMDTSGSEGDVRGRGRDGAGEKSSRAWRVARAVGKWVGITVAAVITLVVIASGVTYVVRSQEVEDLREPRSFYASTPHFEIELRVAYRSQGVFEGLIEDRGRVLYRLYVRQGEADYDLRTISANDRIILRFLDEEGFLIEDQDVYLSSMSGVVDDDGMRVALSDLGDWRGITSREYKELAEVDALWSLDSQR
jgi:hypothetical protein